MNLRREQNILVGFGLLVLACCSSVGGAGRPPKAPVAPSDNSAVASASAEKGRPDVGSATMTSPKEDCERLMNALVPFAAQMLSAHREFYPFGGAIKPSGEIVQVGGWTGDEHPPSQEVIDVLERGFREGARLGDYKATAMVVDMRIVPPGKSSKQDGVAVRLDHRDGYSAIVIFPYSFSDDQKVTFEEPFAVRGEDRIFSR